MLSEKVRKLQSEIESYLPFNEQEERDREMILRALKTEDQVFFRDNPVCHMTASSWIVNADRTKVLMAYHNIYDSWSWLGGHADGEEDLRPRHPQGGLGPDAPDGPGKQNCSHFLYPDCSNDSGGSAGAAADPV